MKIVGISLVSLLTLLLLVGISSAAMDDGYTVALFHFNNDSFIEEGGQTTYPQGDLGISTTNKVFGAGSLDATSAGSYLAMGDAPGGIWDLWTADATVDCWVYFTSLPTDGTTRRPIYSQQESSDPANIYNLLTIQGNKTIKWISKYGGNTYVFYNGTASSPISLNTWHHIAVVRSGDTFKGFIDGVNVPNHEGTSSTQFRFIITGNFLVGATQAEAGGGVIYLDGYMDEFRYSNGIARWTSDFTPPTEEYQTDSWVFDHAGSFPWVCPDYVDEIFISAGAAGGGGRGPGIAGGGTGYLSGLGGDAGEWGNISSVSVIHGHSYTIVIGDKGLGGSVSRGGPPLYEYIYAYPTSGGNTQISDLGITMIGGPSGLVGGTNVAGGPGGSGFLSATLFAENGTSGDYSGGLAGSGYSAGGGGAGADSDTATRGGNGSVGYIKITRMSSSSCNAAEFSASNTNLTSGSLTRFTDLSTIRNTGNLSYLWDFGDGYTSGTQGNVNHVYAWNGVFTVNLTISSDECSDTESKPEYITVSINNENSSFSYNVPVSPRYADIYVKTVWGSPIENATVVMTPLSTSTGTFDWLLSALGIDTGGFNPNSTVMTQTTDIQGRTSFYVLPTAKYDVNITKPGYTFQDGSLVPSDTQYTFRSDLVGTDVFVNGYNELDVITFKANGTELNATTGRIHTEYNDSLGQTTSVVILVNQSHTYGNFTNETTVASYSHGSGNFTHDFDLAGTRDHSYLVRMRSAGSTFSAVSRDYGITFPPGPISLGIPENLLVYAGMFGLIFISLCFTRVSGGPGPAVIVTMFFAWIFYLMRWWRDMAPEWLVISALTFFTFVAILFNIMLRSKKTYVE